MSVDRIIALRDAGREASRLWGTVADEETLIAAGQRRMAWRMLKRINQMIVDAGGVPLSEAEIEEELP